MTLTWSRCGNRLEKYDQHFRTGGLTLSIAMARCRCGVSAITAAKVFHQSSDTNEDLTTAALRTELELNVAAV